MPNPLFTRKYRTFRQKAWITFGTVLVGFWIRGILGREGILPTPPNAEALRHMVFYPMVVALFLLWIMPDAFEGRRRRNNRARGDLYESPAYEAFEELWPRVSIWKPILIGICILAAIEIKFWLQ